MSAKSRGCAVLRYLMLQQLVLVTEIWGQTRGPPPIPPPPGSRPNPNMYPRIVSPKYTGPTHYNKGFTRFRPETMSPFNHKNSLYNHPNTSPRVPAFTNHKSNEFRPAVGPTRRPIEPQPSGSYKIATYAKPNEPYPEIPHSERPYHESYPEIPHSERPYHESYHPTTKQTSKVHEYQQNYYKLQKAQEQFFNQPVQHFFQQQQQLHEYQKEQHKLEEQHAQHSQKSYTRVRFPDEGISRHKYNGQKTRPHHEEDDNQFSESSVGASFERHPLQVSQYSVSENSQHKDNGNNNYEKHEEERKSSTENYSNQETQLSNKIQKPFLTPNQIRALTQLKGPTALSKLAINNYTIPTNVALLSSNIDSKHKKLMKFMSNQIAGVQSRDGTDSAEREDTFNYQIETKRSDLSRLQNPSEVLKSLQTPTSGIFNVPSSTYATPIIKVNRDLTTVKYFNSGTVRPFSFGTDHTRNWNSNHAKRISVPVVPTTTYHNKHKLEHVSSPSGQLFSFDVSDFRNQAHFPGSVLPEIIPKGNRNNVDLISNTVIKEPPSNVTHLFGVSVNDTSLEPRFEALHYYGRLTDDEDREELYRMIQNVTLLSDIRKQILESIQRHKQTEDAADYDGYSDPAEEDDDGYVFTATGKNPNKISKIRPPHDLSPEITIHSDLMSDYEKSRPHSANVVELASSHRDCRLRSRRYISDGQCTSPRPITEAVCADSCTMPSYMFNPSSGPGSSSDSDDSDDYLEDSKSLASTNQFAGWLRRRQSKRRQDFLDDDEVSKKVQWQCEASETAKKRINLLCHDGTLRQYRLKITASCRCRKHSPYLASSASNKHPISLGSAPLPVTTVLKPIPIPYPVPARGKKKRKKHKHKAHHHYHGHSKKHNHNHKHRSHKHYHNHGGAKSEHHSSGPRPLTKKQLDHIKKKINKVLAKHKRGPHGRKSSNTNAPQQIKHLI